MAKVYLIPTLIGEQQSVDPMIVDTLTRLDTIIAESQKGAARILQQYLPKDTQLPILLCNEHTPIGAQRDIVRQVVNSEKSYGLMVDAGMPGVADAGSMLIFLLHQANVPVIPLPGVSAITTALMASGLDGQKFVFHGYLPRDTKVLRRRLAQIGQQTQRDRYSHIWIEAPYRSAYMLRHTVETLAQNTRNSELFLSVSSGLFTETQLVVTKPLAKWSISANLQAGMLAIDKQPTVFLVGLEVR